MIIWHLHFLFPDSGFNVRILNIQRCWIFVYFPLEFSSPLWMLLLFHNNLFSTLEFHRKCNYNCISMIVPIPHWNFIAINKWIIFLQFVSFPHWNFITFWLLFVIPQTVPIPHRNFIITADKLCFHNRSLFRFGISSSSPINCVSTIGLYSPLEFHHRHQ